MTGDTFGKVNFHTFDPNCDILNKVTLLPLLLVLFTRLVPYEEGSDAYIYDLMIKSLLNRKDAN
jgi:hypothetical protein